MTKKRAAAVSKDFLLGLAGARQVGKTTIAQHLVANHGFFDIHPFSGGKAACRAYFTHIGASEEEAWRMTDGDLKDTPSHHLPRVTALQASPKTGQEGEYHKPRFLMEHFGKMMGTVLGPDWTIGKEIELARRHGEHTRFIVSSLVYEDQVVRAMGGVIWRLSAPNRPYVAGLETDAYTRAMQPDLDIVNDGSVEDLFETVERHLEEAGLALGCPDALDIA